MFRVTIVGQILLNFNLNKSDVVFHPTAAFYGYGWLLCRYAHIVILFIVCTQFVVFKEHWQRSLGGFGARAGHLAKFKGGKG